MSAILTHPDPHTLAEFALGRLAEPLRGEVEAHVAACDECCRRLEHASEGSLLGLAREAMATAVADLGETIGTSPALPPELHNHPRYRVLEQLGAGGMGVVFKAEHRKMGRIVALKVLSGRTMAKAGAIGRFQREVRLASRLSHPNIVIAYDADEVGGHHFLIMEYVEGVSLDKLVARRGPLPVTMACHFIRQAALGLKHAHEKGMIHRDIKPHNLMVTSKGQVKVLDFGLACVARGDGEEATSATAQQMTSPDMVLGTPDFLSPEQARSSATVDGRADIYSLGCTLFFLLTGRPPFGGSQPFEKLVAHVQNPVPAVSVIRPDVPAALSDYLQQMMAKNPGDRPQTPTEVAAALLPFTKAGAAPVVDALPVVVAAPVADVPLGDTLVEEVAERDTDVAPKRKRKKPVPFHRKHRNALVAGAVALVLLLAAGALASVAPWKDWTTASTPTGSEGGNALVNRSPNRGAAPTATGQPEVLIVLPMTDVWSPDYDPVKQMLEQGGLTVRTASVTRAPCRRHRDRPGEPITPDLTLAEVDPAKFRGVIFIGAGVWEYLPGNRGAQETRRIIDAMVRDEKPVGAICLGSRVLVEHGYLNGKFVARTEFTPMFQNKDVKWDDTKRVVAAKPFITASADRDAKQFVTALLPHLRAGS